MSLKRLATFLKSKRKKANLSIRALASKVNCSKSHLFLIEKGERNPSDELLLSICKELGVDAEEAIQINGRLTSDLTKYLINQPDLIKKIRWEMLA